MKIESTLGMRKLALFLAVKGPMLQNIILRIGVSVLVICWPQSFYDRRNLRVQQRP